MDPKQRAACETPEPENGSACMCVAVTTDNLEWSQGSRSIPGLAILHIKVLQGRAIAPLELSVLFPT